MLTSSPFLHAKRPVPRFLLSLVSIGILSDSIWSPKNSIKYGTISEVWSRSCWMSLRQGMTGNEYDKKGKSMGETQGRRRFAKKWEIRTSCEECKKKSPRDSIET
jgi:hypothetical protein